MAAYLGLEPRIEINRHINSVLGLPVPLLSNCLVGALGLEPRTFRLKAEYSKPVELHTLCWLRGPVTIRPDSAYETDDDPTPLPRNCLSYFLEQA